MSIFYSIEGSMPSFIEISTDYVAVQVLKTFIAKKIGHPSQDLRIVHSLTGLQFAYNQYIQKGTTVAVKKITINNSHHQPYIELHKIINHDMLQNMMQDCKIYMVKSCNDDNILKARDCSVWATTIANQQKLKSAFHCFQNVFLLFATSKSFEIKGLARMESQPEKYPDKTIWSGVTNIRLGGNFKIRWIRKKPLSLATVDKTLGSQFKDEILKASDGHELELELIKKVIFLFEVPTEPYYQPEPPKKPQIPTMPIEMKNPKEQIMNLKEILGAESLHQIKGVPNVSNFFITPHQLIMNSQIASITVQKQSKNEKEQLQNSQEKHQARKKKKNKEKKIKKKSKKSKKKKRKRSSSSSSSSSSASSSSRSSHSKDYKYRQKKQGKKDRRRSKEGQTQCKKGSYKE